MLYNNFKSLKLPALGLGAMRLPVIAGDDTVIDETAVAEMIGYAMQHGINYFDTAWGYHGGNSERVMGALLGRYPRESYYLASKFPGYDLSNMERPDEIFEEQLRKCRVDYFDFYMLHNVCEMNLHAYLEKNGILGFLFKQKTAGRIRHLGFSTHGSLDVMKTFLENCGEQMDFCLIQVNYLDWSFQNAKEKVALLNDHHIPIWVMEPMRGGSLASLAEEDTAKLKALRPDEDTPAWAFRFLQSIPGVVVTLSGMSSLKQLRENIKTFETEEPLCSEEFDLLLQIAAKMVQTDAVPCTSCRYCLERCPQSLDIPHLIKLYNEHCYTLHSGLPAFIAPMALLAMPKDKLPGSCIGCGSCEAVCPQQIKISDVMVDFMGTLQ